jgi:D-sedoheptulose 7-phosphate isomerase
LLEIITSTLEESAQLIQRVSRDYARQIEAVVRAIVDVYQRGNKVFLFGNGGSAADAQHLAGEFVNRFLFDRPALGAISLSTDTSVLTCIANDASFETVFSRQIEALGQEGDLAWGFSTSGNSPNVLKAVEAAKARKMITVGFTGGEGGKLAELVDLAFVVPTLLTPRIQEVHIITGHIICQLVESHLFSEPVNQ